MLKKFSGAIFTLSILFVVSCSKKHLPQTTENTTVNTTARPTEKKIVVKKIPPAPVHKVIIVNDSVAKKNFDGRLYYDVDGRRYWKNYDDGKYYLFNKTMYTNSAFKPH